MIYCDIYLCYCHVLSNSQIYCGMMSLVSLIPSNARTRCPCAWPTIRPSKRGPSHCPDNCATGSTRTTQDGNAPEVGRGGSGGTGQLWLSFWICFLGYVFLDMFLMFFIRKKNSIAWSFPMEASLFFEGVKPQRPSRWENRSHMNLSTATVRRLHAALARPQYRWPGPKKSQSIESTIVQEHLILRFRWKRREMRAVR